MRTKILALLVFVVVVSSPPVQTQTIADRQRVLDAIALITAVSPPTAAAVATRLETLVDLNTLLLQVSPSLAPLAPSSLVTTPISTTQVNISWVDNSNNETAFVVEGSFTGAVNSFFVLPNGVLPTNSTTYSNPGLSPATTYYWRVKARNATGDSPYTPQVAGTTLGTAPPPAPQCADGIDNDNDGLIDLADPGCSNAQDNTEETNPPLAQCANGIDDDGDGLVDLADPGCLSATDNDETNTSTGGPSPGEIRRIACGPTGAAYPVCASDGNWETGGAFTRSLRIGGPTGSFTEWNSVPNYTQMGQPYTGRALNVAAFGAQQRYIRFPLRIATGFNPAGNGDVWTDKLIILGQGAADRMICVISPSMALSSSPNVQFLGVRCTKGIGGPSAAEPVPLVLGAWNMVEIGVRSGGPTTLRIGNNSTTSYESPTWNWPSGTILGIGFYQNATIAPSGSLGLGIGDVIWASLPDPNWR